MNKNVSNDDAIKEFIKLHSDSTKNTLKLYASSNDIEDSASNQPNVSVQDVISSVAASVKAMESADGLRCRKKYQSKHENTNRMSKALHLPVRPVLEVTQPINANKFETQCVSDTQLINIAQAAEDMYDFMNIDLSNGCHNDFTERDSDCAKKPYAKLNCGSNDNVMSNVDCNDMNLDEEFLNNCFVNENKESDRCVSPVLPSSGTISHKLMTPESITVDLAKHEQFESEMFSKICSKQIINSQIIGKELQLNKELQQLLEKDTENIDDVISKNVNDEVNINSNDNESNGVDVDANSYKSFLEDDILFSSDEEEDYMRKQTENPIKYDHDKEDNFSVTPDNDISTELFAEAISGNCTKTKMEKENQKDNFVVERNSTTGIDNNTSNQTMEKCELIIHREDNENMENEYYKAKLLTEKHVTPVTDIKHNHTNVSTLNGEEFGIINEAMSNNELLNLSPDTNNKLNCNKPKFQGFFTASHKIIKVSEKTLARTKNIFRDIDLTDDFSNKLYNMKDIPEDKAQMFKSNTSIEEKMSKSALDINKYFDPIPAETENLLKSVDQSEKLTINQQYLSLGIQEKTTVNAKIMQENNTKDYRENVAGIEDAGEKMINISNYNNVSTEKNSLKSVKRKHSNHDDLIEQAPKNSTMDSISNENTEEVNSKKLKFKGFLTASHKVIKVSDEALVKTKNMFQDINFTNNTPEELNNIQDLAANNCIGNHYEQIKPPVLKQSSTTLNVTNNTNDNYRSFHEQANVPTCSKNLLKRTEEGYNFNEQKFPGFVTASHKVIKVSEETLAKTKNIFRDIDFLKELNEPEENCVDIFETHKKDELNITSNEKDTFQFADSVLREKNIAALADNNLGLIATKNVLHASLNKVQSHSDLINDNNSEEIIQSSQTEDCVNKKRHNMSSDKTGKKCTIKLSEINCNIFQTASNKQVRISEEALTQTKNVFDDCENDDMAPNKTETAFSNEIANRDKENLRLHTLTITKKVKDMLKMHMARDNIKLFDAIENIKDENVCNKNEKRNVAMKKKDLNKLSNIELGFKTGNNNSVKMTNESLAKSKHLFSDLMDNNMENDMNREYFETNLKNGAFKDDNNVLDSLLNTQIANNFQDTLCTEDFHRETADDTERPLSPILHLSSRYKRRKIFQTPYKSQSCNKTEDEVNGLQVDDKPFPTPFKAESTNKKTLKKTKFKYNFNREYKKNKLLTLKDLQTEYDCSLAKDPFLFKYDFDSLLSVEFEGSRNNLTDNNMTIADLVKVFSSSTDKYIIPDGWIENHLRLILWKLISYEMKFPSRMSGVCNAKEVLHQLKYRYDRELERIERPALRKIFEKDDSAAKCIVLCVVKVFVDGECVARATSLTSTIELLLTDGWYCIRAVIDQMLSELVVRGKIIVGTKIMTHGAELLHCDQGMSPWEDTSRVRLRLCGNSSRRARWYARLGYHGDAGPPCRLGAVHVGGGRVARARVHVARVYPTLYIERFQDGSTVTRTQHQEEMHQLKYDTERQALLERIYDEVLTECKDVDVQDSDDSGSEGLKRKSLDSGSQIAKAMKKCKDSQDFRTTLTDAQINSLCEYNNRRCAKLTETVQRRVQERLRTDGAAVHRNVVSLVRLRVCDHSTSCGAPAEVSSAVLTVWRASEATMEALTEGACVDIYNLCPTGYRNKELQLSAGRQSVIKLINKTENEDTASPLLKQLRRKCYHIKEIIRNPSSKPPYNEIDTVGLIFLIEPSTDEFNKHSDRNVNFQNVYLTDEDKNFVCVNFWGGVRKCGFENVLDTGQIVAAVNLQKRLGNTRKNIPQFRVTEYSQFTKTPKCRDAKDSVLNMSGKFRNINVQAFCLDCVNLKSKMAQSGNYRNNESSVSPYRLNNSDFNISKHKMFIESPLAKKDVDVEKELQDLNLDGLDFGSTFTQTCVLSPRTLLRKQQVEKRINKLKMYPEPPALSPISIVNRPTNAYKSPFALKCDISTTSVVSVENNPSSSRNVDNIANNKIDSHSPILSRKRSFGNPVKLNFSESCNNEDVDPFQEDIDFSPPLSFD